jgi:hypothetical protein
MAPFPLRVLMRCEDLLRRSFTWKKNKKNEYAKKTDADLGGVLVRSVVVRFTQ